MAYSKAKLKSKKDELKMGSLLMVRLKKQFSRRVKIAGCAEKYTA
jgi:hypothetical protein